MSKLTVYNQQGGKTGEFEIPDDLLLSGTKGAQALQDALTAYQRAQRAGTASTKRKGEVAGSNKKPWRQKGTGRARAGYRQSPVWRGGSVAFGPHPRDFGVKVNKRAGRLAFRRAFSDTVQADEIRLLDDLVIEDGKTKSFVAVMTALKLDAPALFVVDKIGKSTGLSSRNLPKVEMVDAAALNAYQLVRYPAIVMTRAACEAVIERVTGKGVPA